MTLQRRMILDSAMKRLAVAASALLLVVACNGDPLNASSTGTSQAPEITTPPTNVSVLNGQTATFTVSATGTAPLTYQWRRNGDDIPGATLSSYTLTTTSTDNGALFDVLVANTFGSVDSSSATLTVQ
ncbi:MAG TPA: immunoglobulin domain-containing protein [Burkholderiaceae bacterium]|nr:immunoglobulin domain-containing protein [Burkholderiaceae bacterium]